MKTLHLYPADDPLIAAHVALLQEGEESFSGQPDIVHVHGCWRYNIVRQAMRAHRQGARIVMTPHNGLSPWIVSERRMTEKLSKTLLWQRRMVESAYVIIAQGPMETKALTELGWNPRIETIRNAVVTNSITPEATRRHTLDVYRKVLDSNTIELMSDDSRRLMTMLHEEDETLVPTDVRLTAPYRNEQDAMHVLYTLTNLYEPVRLFRHLRRKKKTDESEGKRGTVL